jgi:cytochrome c
LQNKIDMRKSPFLPWVLLLVACFTSSVTCANIDLAKRNACMSCHAIEKKLVGPAFKEVSSKYSQKENAANQLAQSIKKGGAGKWGPVPMPPPTSLSDQDALIIAKWIIEGAK